MDEPKTFWGYVILTTIYLINKMSSKILDYKTPMEELSILFSNFQGIGKLPLKFFRCVSIDPSFEPEGRCILYRREWETYNWKGYSEKLVFYLLGWLGREKMSTNGRMTCGKGILQAVRERDWWKMGSWGYEEGFFSELQGFWLRVRNMEERITEPMVFTRF